MIFKDFASYYVSNKSAKLFLSFTSPQAKINYLKKSAILDLLGIFFHHFGKADP